MFKLQISLLRILVLFLFSMFGVPFIYDTWGGTLTITDAVVFLLAQLIATFKITIDTK